MENKISTRIIAVTSGKGGVGKTNISSGLAIALAKEGHRVCLFDADIGLANVNILLGLHPEYNLEDLVSGDKTLDDILIRDFHGIDIIPGSSGVEGIANLNEHEVRLLIGALGALSGYDFIIFDTSAGIAAPVIAFCMAASEVLIVITPEPTSLTDAYALLKVLLANGFNGKARIVVNQCRDINQAKRIFQKFSEAVLAHLKVKINLTGVVLSDPNLTASVKEQKSFLLLYPDSKASKCVRHIARTLLSVVPEGDFSHDLGTFWQQCFNIIKSPLSIKGVRNKAQAIISHGKDGGAVQGQGEKEEKASSGGARNEDVIPVAPAADNRAGHEGKEVHPDQGESGVADMPVLIRELTRGVTMVSDELRQIRESMADAQPRKAAGNAATDGMIELVRNDNMFILDYEAFLKKHHSN